VGETAHRRGAYPRGRPREFKGSPAARRTDGRHGVPPH